MRNHNWIKVYNFYLYFLLLNLCAMHTEAEDAHENCSITIFPGEYIRMDTDAKVNLVCDASSYDMNAISSELQLWENDQKINDFYKRSINTIITTFDVKMKRNNTYMCDKISPTNMNKTKEIILGNRPPPVNHFNCLSRDFDEWKCTFESNERISTSYKVSYSINGHIYDCQCIKTNQLYECRAQLYRKTYDTYDFAIKSQNCFGNRTEYFSFNIHDVVIPGDVHLTIENASVTSTGLNFSWNIDTNNEVLYEVKGLLTKGKYKSNYDKRWTTFNKNTTYIISSTGQLESLIPYTNYTLNWRVKGIATPDSEEMWKGAHQSFMTKPQRPIKSPTVDKGAFYIDNSQCAHIFWRAISSHKRNGTNFGYTLQIISSSENIITNNFTDKFYYNRICGAGNYTILIWSTNSEGSSPMASSIQINVPAEHLLPEPPKPLELRAYYSNKNKTLIYNLEWKPPDLSQQWRILDYTVSRCKSKTLSFELCEDAIHFARLPANQTTMAFRNKKSNLIFAVSANYENTSSGMILPLCIPHEKTPLRRINLKRSYITESSVTVDWNVICEERTLVTSYMLQYCTVDVSTRKCSGPLQTIRNISNESTRHTITNLRPYSNYSIILKFRSKHMHGPISSRLFVQTAEAAPSAPRNFRVCATYAEYAILEWEKPLTPNGIIRFYKILINGNVEHEVPGTTFYYNLTNLDSFQTYKVQVKAVTIREKMNLLGHGSNVVVIKTEGREPGKVTSLIPQGGNSHVSISWNEPREIYGPVDAVQYELNYTYEGTTESVLTTSKAYKLTCSPNRTLDFCVRAVQTIQHSQNDKIGQTCRHLKPQFTDFNYFHLKRSKYYGNWVCFSGNYCSPDSFQWTLFGEIVSITILILLLLMYIVHKHKLMKTLKIIVPQGLDDIYESPCEKDMRPMQRNTTSLHRKLNVENSSPTNSLARSSTVFMEHTGSNINLSIQIKSKDRDFRQEEESVLTEIHKNDDKPAKQALCAGYVDLQSMKNILTAKKEIEVHERKQTEFEDISQPEAQILDDSYNFQIIPSTGYVTFNMTRTPRNSRKHPTDDDLQSCRSQGQVTKNLAECYEITNNNETGYCQIHVTKTLPKVSDNYDTTENILKNKDVGNTDIPQGKTDSLKHIQKNDLSNLYVTMEDLSILACHQN